jgi:hypothetical protein
VGDSVLKDLDLRPGKARNTDYEDTGACFVVKDTKGQKLAYVYYEEEPGAPIICLFGPPGVQIKMSTVSFQH